MDNTNATLARDLVRRTSNGMPGSPIRSADDLAAAFLVGYGPATREAYGRDLRAWSSWLAEQRLAPLDAHRAHVELWARAMEAQGLAPATVARRLSALAGFYDYAADEALISRSPVARVRRPRVSDDSPRLGVDREEMIAFLGAAERSGTRDCALACLLALNGLRISETLALDVEDLGEERGHRTAQLLRKGGGGRLLRWLRGRLRPSTRCSWGGSPVPCSQRVRAGEWTGIKPGRSSCGSRGRPGSKRPSPPTRCVMDS